MNPLEITNYELGLAIAEIIAKEKGWELYLAKPGGIGHWITGKGIRFIPRYPSDLNAALGLIPKDMDFTLNWDRHIKKWGATIAHTSGGDCDSPARAICEAWLTARRNDG